MKCKYCDYENKKDAVLCECCGATLSTQRSVKEQKREAKRASRLRARARRVKPERVSEKKTAEKSGSGRKKLALIAAVTVALVLLLLLAVFFTLLILHRRSDSDVYAPGEEYEDRYVMLYDPEAKTYRFLKDGKLIDGSIDFDENIADRVPVVEENGGAFFRYAEIVSQDGVERRVTRYFFLSKYGVKELDLASYLTGNSTLTGKRVSSDGRFLIISVSGYSSSSIGDIYAYDGMGDGKAVRICKYASDLILLEDSRIVFCDRSEGICRLTVYDLSSGESRVLSNGNSIYSIDYHAEGRVLSFGIDGEYIRLIYLDSGETVDISSPGKRSFVISPDFKTVAFATIQGNEITGFETTAYLYHDRELKVLGEDMLPISVSNGGKYVYATSTAKDSVYSITGILDAGGGEVKKLAEGASVQAVSKDKKQVLIIAETGVYISANGNYPMKIHDPIRELYPITSCENGFAGEIFYIGSRGAPGLYRLGSDYVFSSLSKGQTRDSYKLLSDEKTVVFYDNTLIYRAKAGVGEKTETVGPAVDFSLVSPSGREGYLLRDSLLFVKDGRARIVDKDAFSNTYGYGAISTLKSPIVPLPDGGAIYFKKRLPEMLADSNYATSGSTVIDAYYTKGEKKGKFIIGNVANAFATDSAIYVYVRSKKQVQGYSGALFDVYTGRDVESLTLVLSGVTDYGCVPVSEANGGIASN